MDENEKIGRVLLAMGNVFLGRPAEAFRAIQPLIRDGWFDDIAKPKRKLLTSNMTILDGGVPVQPMIGLRLRSTLVHGERPTHLRLVK